MESTSTATAPTTSPAATLADLREFLAENPDHPMAPQIRAQVAKLAAIPTTSPSTNSTAFTSASDGTASANGHEGGTTPGATPTMQEAAATYHAHGLSPIPWRHIRRGAATKPRKAPVLKRWNHPETAQRPSFDAVLAELAKNGTGVGLVTGRPGAREGRSGIIVVDVEGPQKATPGDPTPFRGTTPTVGRTPSGGWHFYYADDRSPDDREIKSVAGVLPGVDVRADRNGYVAAWPSTGYRFESGVAELLAGKLPGFSTVRHLLVRPASTGAASDTGSDWPQREPGWAERELEAPATPQGQQRDMANSLAGHLAYQVGQGKLSEEEAEAKLWGWAQRLDQNPYDPWEVESAEGIAGILQDKLDKDAKKPPTFETVPGEGFTQSSSGGGTPDLTDIGNARRFAQDHRDYVRYVYPWKRWHVFDGRRWVADTSGLVVRLAQQTADAIFAEAAAFNGDPDVRKRRVKLAIKARDDHRVRAMLSQAQPLCSAHPREFDRDPWLLNCLNGTVNLKTGKLQPHNRDDRITKLAPVEYHREARSELWEKFLHDVTGGYGSNGDPALEGFLQRAAGYSLTGDTGEEVVFLPLGAGGAGMTTFIEAIRTMLGEEYASKADFESFCKSRNNRGTSDPRSGLARLDGIRFVAAVEAEETRHLSEARIKELSGGDTVVASQLYQSEFEYHPQFKIWLAANQSPNVSGEDSALWRRLVRIPFAHSIPKEHRDPAVKTALTNDPAARAAILVWTVKGCLAWQRRGRLDPPTVITASTDAYREEMDTFGDFLDEHCDVGRQHVEKFSALFNANKEWRRRNGELPLSRRAFAAQLQKHGFKPPIGGSNTTRVYVGLQLKPNVVTTLAPAAEATSHAAGMVG